MTVQTVFHGINRSAAVEAAVEEKWDALKRFDQYLTDGKVTISQEGHQTLGAFSVRIDVNASGHPVIVNRTNMDVMAALNEAFDSVRRAVKEEADKRRQH